MNLIMPLLDRADLGLFNNVPYDKVLFEYVNNIMHWKEPKNKRLILARLTKSTKFGFSASTYYMFSSFYVIIIDMI